MFVTTELPAELKFPSISFQINLSKMRGLFDPLESRRIKKEYLKPRGDFMAHFTGKMKCPNCDDVDQRVHVTGFAFAFGTMSFGGVLGNLLELVNLQLGNDFQMTTPLYHVRDVCPRSNGDNITIHP